MNIGVIFDWDGVVIDSSVQHERSWELLAEEEKLFLPEDHFERSFGKKNAIIIPDILKWTDDPQEIVALGDRKEELYRELLEAEGGPTMLPGVVRLLEELKEAGVPCAIGSSTPKENLDMSLRCLKLGSYFSGMVSGDDVVNGKPHPEVFLKAAESIHRIPQRCVVFEDSVHGLEAGLKGSMKVVGLATTHTADKLTIADWVVNDLGDVTLDQLVELIEK